MPSDRHRGVPARRRVLLPLLPMTGGRTLSLERPTWRSPFPTRVDVYTLGLIHGACGSQAGRVESNNNHAAPTDHVSSISARFKIVSQEQSAVHGSRSPVVCSRKTLEEKGRSPCCLGM